MDIKVGDQVLVHKSAFFSNGDGKKATVVKVCKNYFVVEYQGIDCKFNNKTMRQCGNTADRLRGKCYVRLCSQIKEVEQDG